MKIGEINSANKSVAVKKKKSSSPDGNFGALISDDSEAVEHTSSSISGINPIGAIGGLLSLQEVGSEQEKAKRKIKHGQDLLSYLDELRHDMLAGNISPVTVKNLANEARQQSEYVMDPELNEVLNEIEIRAEVELTKLEMEAKNDES